MLKKKKWFCNFVGGQCTSAVVFKGPEGHIQQQSRLWDKDIFKQSLQTHSQTEAFDFNLNDFLIKKNKFFFAVNTMSTKKL